jgi:hypothetical protein
MRAAANAFNLVITNIPIFLVLGPSVESREWPSLEKQMRGRNMWGKPPMKFMAHRNAKAGSSKR